MTREWKRFGAVVVAVTLLTASLVGSAPPAAEATAAFAFHRLAGETRFDTARLIAEELGPSAALVVARADVFADAMTGTYIAGVLQAPVVLTRSGGIPPETDAAIRATGARRAVIVGSTSAVATSVEIGLRARGLTVERVGGATRYDTAALAAQYPAPGGVGVLDGLRTAIVVSGLNFPDALSGGPLSFARGFPILLTNPTSLSPQVLSAIQALGIGQVLVLGGTSAVSTSVDSALRARGVVVARAAGANRAATSVEVAKLAIRRLGFSDRHVNIARGDDFPDALALAPHAGRDRQGSAAGPQPSPVQLTLSPTFAGPELLDDLRSRAVTLDSGHIAGGPAAVTPELEDELRLAATTGTARIRLDISSAAPGGSVPGTVSGDGIGMVSVSGCGFSGQTVRTGAGAFTLTVPAGQAPGDCLLTFTTNFTSGRPTETDVLSLTVRSDPPTQSQAYGVTGPAATTQSVDTDRACSISVPAGTVVDLRIVPTSSITASTAGVAFSDLNGDGAMDEPAMLADFVALNGAALPAADEVNDVTAGVGPLTVTLRSSQPEDVTVVVWSDQAGLSVNALDVAGTTPGAKASREPHGVGCRSAFVSAAGAGTGFGPAPVSGFDKGADSLAAGGTSFVYDANDTFVIDGVVQPNGEAGMAAFESRLSAGDSVSGSYVSDRSGVSTFSLTDSAPVAPSSLQATADSTSATVSFPESPTPTTDSYNLYRVVRSGTTCPDFASSRSAYGSPAKSLADTTPNQVGAAAITSTDSGLQAGTTYCYAVTAVDDGDESNTAAQASATTAGATATTTTTTVEVTTSTTSSTTSSTTTSTSTSTTSTTSPPRIADARAADGGGGTMDAPDVHQFVFTEPMSATVDDPGSIYTVQDADGSTASVECGVTATCVLLPAGTYEGQSYPAGQVLRVRLTGTPTASGGTFSSFEYGSGPTITAIGAQWRDVDGNQVDVASGDRVLEIAPLSPPADGVGPTVMSAEESGPDQIAFNLSEAVAAACGFIDLNQFLFQSPQEGLQPTAATLSGSSVILTFDARSPIENNSQSEGSFQYGDGSPTGADCGDIVDLNGNPVGNFGPASTTDAV